MKHLSKSLLPRVTIRKYNIKVCLHTSSDQGGFADSDNSASWLRLTFLGRNMTILGAICFAMVNSLSLTLVHTIIKLELKLLIIKNIYNLMVTDSRVEFYTHHMA